MTQKYKLTNETKGNGNMYNLIKKIDEQRRAQNMTQRELAYGAGIHAVEYSRYLHGKTTPNFTVLVRLLAVLGLEFRITRKEKVTN